MRSRNEVPIISGRHQTLIKLGLGILLVSGVMALAFIGCGGGSSSSNSGSSAVSEALGITDTDLVSPGTHSLPCIPLFTRLSSRCFLKTAFSS